MLAISSRNSPQGMPATSAWLMRVSSATRIADRAYTPSPSRGTTRNTVTGASAVISVARRRRPGRPSTIGTDHRSVDKPCELMPNTSYPLQQATWTSSVNAVIARGIAARRYSPRRNRTPLVCSAPSGTNRRRTGAVSEAGDPSAGAPVTNAVAIVSLDAQLYSVPTASTASGMRMSEPGTPRRASAAE